MDRLGADGPEEEIELTESPCEDCGDPVKAAVILGSIIPRRFCDPCSAIRTERERAEERARDLERALERAGATSRLLRYSLESHPTPAAAVAAREWLAGYLAGYRRNFYLSGPLGLGKTGLAWGIARAIVEHAIEAYWALGEGYGVGGPRESALFVVWRDLLHDLKADIGGAELEDDPTRILSRATYVPVLVLDDLGAERPTAYAAEQLATLVDRRYHRELPIIVTSNLTARELAEVLSPDGVLSGARIVSRLAEGALSFRFEGRSLRRGTA